MLPFGSNVASLRLLMGSTFIAGTTPAEAEARSVARMVVVVKSMLTWY